MNSRINHKQGPGIGGVARAAAMLGVLLAGSAVGQELSQDPLARTETLVESSEIVLIWDDRGQGRRVARQRLYDYLDLENNDPQIYPAPLHEEPPEWDVQSQRYMDVLVGNLDGQGSQDVVATWVGLGDSINVVVPEIDSGTLSWSNASRQRIDRGLGPFDTAIGDFDGDRRDEIVLAFINDDGQIELRVLDSDGTLVLHERGGIADQSSQGSYGRAFAIEAGDFDGDRDAEIVLVGWVPDANGEEIGTDWGLYAQVYDLRDGDGADFTFVPRGRLNFLTEPEQRIVDLHQGVATGDFNNDTVDEIAVAVVFMNRVDESTGEDTPLDTQMLVIDVSPTLGSMTFDPADVVLENLIQQDNDAALDIVTGDLNEDARDEIVLGVGRHVLVYEIEQMAAVERTRSSHGYATGVADHEYSQSFLAVANLDLADSQGTDAGEIISVYNTGDGSNEGDQAMEFWVHVIDVDPDTGDWSMVPRVAGQEEEVALQNDGRRRWAMAVGDFDEDRIRVGAPTVTGKTDVRQPLVILNAPPVHFDILDNTQYDVNTCFNDNDCGFSATYERTVELETGVSTKIHSEWKLGAEIGVEGDIYGIKVGAAFKANYGEKFENVESENTTVTMGTTVVATEDDMIYATVADYRYWEYPVYADGVLLDHVVVVQPEWRGNVWYPSKSPETGAAYRPNHEVGNALSYAAYPDSLQQNESLAQLIRGSDSDSYILNDTQHYEWYLKYVHFDESQAETTWAAHAEASVSAGILTLTGEYDTSELTTHTTKVTEELSLKVSLDTVDLGLGNTQYRVTPYTYWSTLGALVMDYAVRPERSLPGEESTWWDDHYSTEPDPGFLMRWRYDPEKGRPVTDAQRQRTNQIFFESPDLIPGAESTVYARVHNLSFLRTAGAVTVRFFVGDPAEGGTPIVGLGGETEVTTASTIEGRDSQLVFLDWVVPADAEDFLRIYAVIDPEDNMTEIHTNNNVGWTVLGIGEGETTPVALAGFAAAGLEEQVLVQWVVAHAHQHRGFHVWRASDIRPDYVRLTDTLLSDATQFVDTAVEPGQEYFYKLEAVDTEGGSTFFGPVTARALLRPMVLSLAQNSPNPFNPITTIQFETPRAGRAALTIFDVTGRVVRRLVDARLPAGPHAVRWDGRTDGGYDVASGAYYYTLRSGDRVEKRKMTLLR